MTNLAKPAAAIMLVTAMLLAVLSETKGAIINAASASIADVTNAVNRAVDGDTVVVPAGTATWTSTLNLGKGITLRGQTTVVGAGTASPTVTDGTVILDNVAIVNNAAPLIQIKANTTGDQVFRITGFTFRNGSRTKLTRPQNAGAVYVTGTVHGAGTGSFRIDHCLFDYLYQNGIFVSGWVTYSVMDHCVENNWKNVFSATINNGRFWNNGDEFGSSSFADAPYLGSEKFFFFEDNTFINVAHLDYTNVVQTTGTIDSQGGSRYVARHNYFENSAPNTHGTESGGRTRGIRLHEWYQNTINFDIGGGGLGLVRGATGLSWGNTLTGSGVKPIGNVVTAERQLFPWLTWGDTAPNVAANGANNWDINVTESDGVTHVDGHAPYSFASGRHNGANNSTTLVDTNAHWLSNQWVGYSLTNTTRGNRPGQYFASTILSNTATTITVDTGNTANVAQYFNTGDGYVIHKVLISMDQSGYGRCQDVIAYDSKGSAYNATTGIKSPLRQTREPLYSWLNTFKGTPMRGPDAYYHSGLIPTIKPNREYYNEISPFDGTSGVGVGLHTNRPKTCTPGKGALGVTGPGAAYWATDEQKLYVCTATNTWSLYYTPYVYPHPLVSGAPAPPANLRILP
jgi:hypothetical protein